MRNLTYFALTGALLCTFIIVGCREDTSPPGSTDNQEAPTDSNHLLGGTNSTSTDINTSKRWSFQINDDNKSIINRGEVTALRYEEDTFTLEKAMVTPYQQPLLISNNYSNGSINILKLDYNRDMIDNTNGLRGQIQTITNTNVIQEIDNFINGNGDIILDSYTEIEDSEEMTPFAIAFYEASYEVKDRTSLPGQIFRPFHYRKDTAYMMIAKTETSEGRQLDVTTAIVFESTPAYLTYQPPLFLSFQQAEESFVGTSSLTGLLEGLGIQGLDPLQMSLDKTVTKVDNVQSIQLTFNQTLNIEGQEIELQIKIDSSNMDPLYLETPFSNIITQTFSDADNQDSLWGEYAKEKAAALTQWAGSWFSSEDDEGVENEEKVENTDSRPHSPHSWDNSYQEAGIPRSWDNSYQAGIPQSRQVEIANKRIRDEADQTLFQVQTSPQNALHEFEERESMPIVRFAEGVTVTPSDCDAIYDQEGLSDNYRDCANSAAQQTAN